MGYCDSELSIVLVDDDEIAELNKRYLNRDSSTNVIAFSMSTKEYQGPHPEVLGDVVISTETAVREANERGVSLKEELALLLAHGILHLLGFNHEDDLHAADIMERKEAEILASLGLQR